MNAPALDLLAELSAMPVAGGDLMSPLRRAATRLVPGVALLLLRECEPDAFAVVGATGFDGRVLLQPRMDFAPAANMAPARPVEPVPCWRPLAAPPSALGAVLTPLDAAARVELGVRLPLGMQPPLALVLVSADERREALGEATVLGLCLVACNLLRNVERVGLIEAQAWIDAELGKLVELQSLLRPEELGGVAGLEVAVRSRPHRYVGGDYYDVSPLGAPDGDAACAFAIADVSGHGPAAAAEAAMIDTIMRTFAGSDDATRQRGPAAVMNYLNRYMFSRRPRPSFATAFLALWHERSRRLRYASAGHLPPLLRPGDGGPCAPLDIGDGIPVNILRDYQWQEQCMTLDAGDGLVLYTDGVTEALSANERQFGLRGLRTAIDGAGESADEVCATVWSALAEHTQGRPNADDQTVLAIRFP